MASIWSETGRLPLAGLTVIDFGQIFQGPYATFLLAKGGAEVIKLEPPGGEPLRRRALPEKQATLPFAMLNQNKRAVTLNLKHARGRELLFEMVRRADVLLENFSPGTMDGLGVGWKVLREINPSLAASFEYYHRTGQPPPRTGNRQAGLSTAPYNVYPCADGHAAIHIVTEGHWRNLLKTMGREELADDPRFKTNADRIAHMDETDAVVTEWTRTLPKMEVFARAKANRVPCAPVRTAPEVMHDPHMHERGMLEEVEHPDLGRITVPTTPLRLHGSAKPPMMPSPKIGQHNDEIYGGW